MLVLLCIPQKLAGIRAARSSWLSAADMLVTPHLYASHWGSSSAAWVVQRWGCRGGGNTHQQEVESNHTAGRVKSMQQEVMHNVQRGQNYGSRRFGESSCSIKSLQL
jgi:hypothetical protein